MLYYPVWYKEIIITISLMDFYVPVVQNRFLLLRVCINIALISSLAPVIPEETIEFTFRLGITIGGHPSLTHVELL